MKKTIWKYEVPIKDEFELEMPAFSEILTFKAQKGVMCLWALVFPEIEKVKIKFFLKGTGHLIDDTLKLDYIGSVQLRDEALIFHLFKERYKK